MSVHRYAAKRDGNETAIIGALEKAGATVAQLSGKGIPDLLVGFRGVNYLLEVKAKAGRLTPDQIVMLDKWSGPISVVRSEEEALKAIGAIE